MTEEFAFAIHKKLGCIKRIPIHAVGWINKTEWVVYEKFPTEEIYFSEFTYIMEKLIWFLLKKKM